LLVGAGGIEGIQTVGVVEAGVGAGNGEAKFAVAGFPGRTVGFVIQAAQGVFTAHAVHGPGGDFNTVKTQGHGEHEQIKVVEVVGLFRAGIAIAVDKRAVKVVVDRARPHKGEAHIFVELVVGGQGCNIAVHNGGAASHVGQGGGLEAHAHAGVSLRDQPVDVGVFNLDLVVPVSAESCAIARFAPMLVANFKIHRAGQSFGGHGVQLEADALGSAKLVFGIGFGLGSVSISGVLGEDAFAHAKTNQPFALGLEVNGLGPPGHAHQHACCKQCDHAHLFKAVQTIPFS